MAHLMISWNEEWQDLRRVEKDTTTTEATPMVGQTKSHSPSSSWRRRRKGLPWVMFEWEDNDRFSFEVINLKSIKRQIGKKNHGISWRESRWTLVLEHYFLSFFSGTTSSWSRTLERLLELTAFFKGAQPRLTRCFQNYRETRTLSGSGVVR